MSRVTSRGGLRRLTAATLAAGLAIAGLVGVGSTTAAADPPASSRTRVASDTRDVGENVRKQQKVHLSKSERAEFADDAPAAQSRTQLRSQAAADEATGTPIGGEKSWLVLNDYTGSYNAASYVLRGVGQDIEVWVQKNIDFPAGDCRNDGVRNVVTDQQVQSLITEFDSNILPKESEAFSVAPERDGTQSVDVGFGAPLWQILGGGNPDYYKGDGKKTVALISNVRDANYYAPTTPDGQTYIAGFFSPLYNEAFDRNVMTIDSYDWLHRTGANPPDETPGGLCSAKQAARPHAYEGTFAHEYQHLLQYYTDPGENTWLNEGLSDYAQTLVGYVDTTIPYGQKGADSHISCFQGFLGSDTFPYCGAENSLTRWADQGSPSILSDYGAAYSFVTYVADTFGEQAVTFLHRDGANGLASLQSYLDDHAPGLRSTDVVHDWATAMAVDGWLDGKATGLNRDQRSRFSSKQLHSAIDWAWSGSYDSPGAPANGSDYVLGMDGRPVNGNTLGKVQFRGAPSYAPDPLEWTIADGALYAGEGNELDRAAVYSVDVPAGGNLTFTTRYDIEQGWDFGVVQVSTDGGKSYTTLANADTTSTHADGADGKIVSQLPGLTGLSGGWRNETFDLSAYAGKSVLLSFRYLTDAAANGNGGTGPTGWWVKDVKVGDTQVTTGATTDGARSATEVSPIPVAGWKLQAVGWTLSGTKVRYLEVKLNRHNAATLDRKALRKRFSKVDRIGFIVTVDDPKEVATKNASYRLRVNGTLQPGGSGNTGVSPGQLPLSRQLPVRTS
ncbi:hypothetical protein GCM10009841_10810 [Microlunatus panaciterrae]|uniref:Immune inhibitor A peptidase M6 n=1 Tax=Microlunatus panaciterrae TaxID=400768 RepID=A0ABS2RKV4_9ACTN|nr:immune inhibitor A domain-containing protein [Microlunatus panaciterrae]MBM7799640.1 hypothetical protein [Microlunatus panaciterrae]